VNDRLYLILVVSIAAIAAALVALVFLGVTPLKGAPSPSFLAAVRCPLPAIVNLAGPLQSNANLARVWFVATVAGAWNSKAVDAPALANKCPREVGMFFANPADAQTDGTILIRARSQTPCG
jgi:hypothetical protein